MKAMFLCWIIWFIGYFSGAMVIMTESTFGSFFAGAIGGILAVVIGGYFDRRMKCKNS